MEWTTTNNEHYAQDDNRDPDHRYFSVDQFLHGALAKIGEAYEFKNCTTIIFDLWSNGRLLVFDSPDGLVVRANEKVLTQLNSLSFSKYCDKKIDDVANEFSDDSHEFERELLNLEMITWDAIKLSIQNGKARIQLNKFNQYPNVIMLIQGNDKLAHDLVTGERIEMLGQPIESVSLRHCQCIYCERKISEVLDATSAFEVVYFAHEKDIDVSYGTVQRSYESIRNEDKIEWQTNSSFEALITVIDNKYPKSNAGQANSPWTRWISGSGYCLLAMDGSLKSEAKQFLYELVEANEVIVFYPHSGQAECRYGLSWP